MIITFNELRRIKDRLPSGSSQRIADEAFISNPDRTAAWSRWTIRRFSTLQCASSANRTSNIYGSPVPTGTEPAVTQALFLRTFSDFFGLFRALAERRVGVCGGASGAALGQRRQERHGYATAMPRVRHGCGSGTARVRHEVCRLVRHTCVTRGPQQVGGGMRPKRRARYGLRYGLRPEGIAVPFCQNAACRTAKMPFGMAILPIC